MRQHVNFEVGFVLKHFPTPVTRARADHILVVHLLQMSLQGGPRAEQFVAHFALELFENFC